MSTHRIRSLAVIACLAIPGLTLGYAQIRVSHLSPDAPNVDVWVNGEVTLSNVPFLATSDYLRVPEGTYRIQVTPTGSTEPVVIDANVSVDTSVYYTIAATGFLGSGDLAPIVLPDESKGLKGSAKVRFVHASPDASAVDVGLSGGAAVFENVSFRESSDYATLPAGDYDLEVRLAGTEAVALSLGVVTLESGAVYNVFAAGSAGDGTLQAITLLSSEPLPAEVRAAHLSPDAPNVDIWLDGARVLENVPSQAVSSYLTVPAGMRRIQVTPAGAEEPVVIDAEVALEGGSSYTVAATGLLGDGDLAPIVLVDDRMGDSMNGKVRFVHTSPDAPAVDIALGGGGDVLISNAAFRQASEYLSIPPGTYDLEVRLAGTETVALPLPGISIAAGVNVTAFAIGLAGDGSLNALVAVDANEVFIRGDSDSNGSINIGDPINTLRYLFLDPRTPICLDAADADDNAHIQLGDAIYVLSYLFTSGPPPLPPFPEPGTDPTLDPVGCSSSL